MIYEFRDQQTGEMVEIAYPAGKAPGLGCVVKHEGRMVERELSFPAAIKANGLTRFKAHVCDTIERWHPDAPAVDSEGRAVITNRNEQRTFIAKVNARKVAAGEKKLVHIDD